MDPTYVQLFDKNNPAQQLLIFSDEPYKNKRGYKAYIELRKIKIVK